MFNLRFLLTATVNKRFGTKFIGKKTVFWSANVCVDRQTIHGAQRRQRKHAETFANPKEKSDLGDLGVNVGIKSKKADETWGTDINYI
jgi:hypothetical protein